MSKITNYSALKRSLSGKDIQLLYSLLYTTQHSFYESKFNLTNLDWDRHALFLLQYHYGVDNRSFSQLFEEYTLDFFSPVGEEIRKKEFEEYIEHLKSNSNGKESIPQINSREILKKIWDESYAGSTVQRTIKYPSPGKVLLNRLVYIAKHSVKEQTQTPPPGLKRIQSYQRTKFFVNRMERVAKYWKKLQHAHSLHGSYRQNTLASLHFNKSLREYQEDDESKQLDLSEEKLEESSRNRVAFYTTPTQVKIRAFLMDLMKISTPSELISAFISRQGGKKGLSQESIDILKSLQINSFHELEEILRLLLAGDREITLRLQKDDRFMFKRASGSLLKSYMRCPWSFNFRYLFKLRFPDTSGSYSGNVLHEAQDKYQRMVKEASERGEEVNHEQIKMKATSEAIESMEEKAKTATPAIQKQLVQSREKLNKDISDVFEKETAFQKAQKHLLEQGKILRLPEILTEQELDVEFEGIRLLGSIDRVERHFPVDREEYIVLSEFKSSLHPKARPETHHQLMIYAIAYEVRNGKAPDQIALETPQVRHVFTVTKPWMDEAKKHIKESVHQLNSTNILAKPSKANCATCEARSICPSSFHVYFPELTQAKRHIESSITSESAAAKEDVDSTNPNCEQVDDKVLRNIMNGNFSHEKDNSSQASDERASNRSNGKSTKGATMSHGSASRNRPEATSAHYSEGPHSNSNNVRDKPFNSQSTQGIQRNQQDQNSNNSDASRNRKDSLQRQSGTQEKENNSQHKKPGNSSTQQKNDVEKAARVDEKVRKSEDSSQNQEMRQQKGKLTFETKEQLDTHLRNQLRKHNAEKDNLKKSEEFLSFRYDPPSNSASGEVIDNSPSLDNESEVLQPVPATNHASPEITITTTEHLRQLPVQVEDILYQMEKPVPRPIHLPFGTKNQNTLESIHDFLNKLERSKN